MPATTKEALIEIERAWRPIHEPQPDYWRHEFVLGKQRTAERIVGPQWIFASVRYSTPPKGALKWRCTYRTRGRQLTYKDRSYEIDPEFAQKFDRLAEQWRQETMFKSRATDITSHFAYYQIIGMGPKVVPLILRRVQKGEGHWFLALRALTGENPVKAENAGILLKMAEAWLEWGKRRGLIYGKPISMQEARQMALRTSVEIEKRRHAERADESRFLLSLWEDEDSDS